MFLGQKAHVPEKYGIFMGFIANARDAPRNIFQREAFFICYGNGLNSLPPRGKVAKSLILTDEGFFTTNI